MEASIIMCGWIMFSTVIYGILRNASAEDDEVHASSLFLWVPNHRRHLHYRVDSIVMTVLGINLQKVKYID